jgi:haloalkane dehalogenase
MEFIRPMPTWDDFPTRETFQNFRTPGVGEKMILEGNAFVERILPGATIRKLTDEEMAVYRAPFPTPESRRPTKCASGQENDDGKKFYPSGGLGNFGYLFH